MPVSEIRRRLRKLREEFGGGKPEGNRATRYVRDNGVRKAEGEREPEESGGGFF